MYPFYIGKEKVCILSWKPSVNDVFKDGKTNKWYRVTTVMGGRGRICCGRETIAPGRYDY
ncbi:hypothetical protein ABIA69_003384 [Lysinibacillus parviboronicapiens]|uniref:Uncharacterized protein n=1 Tax=Lysinibacillus parviboronicapiens TaxID=436516 RepID=A0ABV2PMM4_9BACI